jgi:predicted MFS family arabinose efflux permease
MTINMMESIKKIMGWCPNANALATKRVLITLPSDEKFLTDKKGKGGMNPVKMGWSNRYRNIALLMTLISFACLGFFMLFILFIHEYSDFVESLSKSFIKGILTAIILAVFISADQWRHLNRINEGKNVRPTKKEFAVMTLLFAGYMFLVFTKKDLPYDFIFVVMMSTGFIFSLINYPMTIYWEWKNRKTIYLIEEKLLRWRPVALPVQAPEKG